MEDLSDGTHYAARRFCGDCSSGSWICILYVVCLFQIESSVTCSFSEVATPPPIEHSFGYALLARLLCIVTELLPRVVSVPDTGVFCEIVQNFDDTNLLEWALPCISELSKYPQLSKTDAQRLLDSVQSLDRLAPTAQNQFALSQRPEILKTLLDHLHVSQVTKTLSMVDPSSSSSAVESACAMAPLSLSSCLLFIFSLVGIVLCCDE